MTGIRWVVLGVISCAFGLSALALGHDSGGAWLLGGVGWFVVAHLERNHANKERGQ